MKAILATNDPVMLSYAEALLTAEDIPCLVADVHMSVLEGSLGILPRRLLVTAEDREAAREILAVAGLEPLP